MKVNIVPRDGKTSKRFPITLEFDSKTNLKDLKQLIQSNSLLNIHRQRLTTSDKKVLEDDELNLIQFGIKDNDNLIIKDLGPQISWRTVFLIEYLGPILIHPLFYYYPKIFYGKEVIHSKMQSIALVLILAHYIKRELETIFVHRFSSATMPLSNLFKNSAHYWILSGVFLAGPLYGSWNSVFSIKNSLRSQDWYLYTFSLIWLFGEFSNFLTHLNLRSLRPAGSKVRKIPTGYGFNLISCPNYFFEAVSWIGFLGLTQDYAAGVFLVVSAFQMLTWAGKKHNRYKKEFGVKYPKSRKAMIPFIY